MSETTTNDPFGFGKLVPGFDFLQNLMDSASGNKSGRGGLKAPGLSNWIAPTLNVDELERRIAELKAVSFWLEQNGRALQATIQALEVQKMTLAALQGMNVAMGDVAKSFRIKEAPGAAAGAAAGADLFANVSKSHPNPYSKSFESNPAEAAGRADDAKPAAAPAPAEASSSRDSGAAQPAAAPAGAGLVDPMQWWGALTGQFQQIAANAMRDAASNPALQASRELTSNAMKSANRMATRVADNARAPAAAPAAGKTVAAKKSPAAAKKSAATKKRAATSRRSSS